LVGQPVVELRLGFRCPPQGTPATVWGSNPYTADSSICTAAVHAGRITTAGGGDVVIVVRPGQSSYEGSTRNGVTTNSWGDYRLSYLVE
jgi:hypothetical protein